MQTLTLDAPALFGDHHVSEVRRILLELSGVKEVYASSGFQAIEVTFDPKKISDKQITECLTAAGYLGTLPMKVENDAAAQNELGGGAYRSTAYYETIKKTVSFSQRVNYQGRPLWPCPGFGPIKEEEG